MAQMYKVFIDNRAISFVQTTKRINKSNWFCVKSKKEIKEVIDIELNTPIFLYAKNMNILFDSFFEKYEKIDAAGGIVQRKNKYLVIKRNGVWDLPKGKVDEGEKIKKAAVREIEEECGIKNPEIIDKIQDTFHIYKFQGKKVLKKTTWFYMLYDGDKKLEGQLDEGITEVKWISYKKLLKMSSKTYGTIQDVIENFKIKN